MRGEAVALEGPVGEEDEHVGVEDGHMGLEDGQHTGEGLGRLTQSGALGLCRGCGSHPWHTLRVAVAWRQAACLRTYRPVTHSTLATTISPI